MNKYRKGDVEETVTVRDVDEETEEEMIRVFGILHWITFYSYFSGIGT